MQSLRTAVLQIKNVLKPGYITGGSVSGGARRGIEAGRGQTGRNADEPVRL